MANDCKLTQRPDCCRRSFMEGVRQGLKLASDFQLRKLSDFESEMRRASGAFIESHQALMDFDEQPPKQGTNADGN